MKKIEETSQFHIFHKIIQSMNMLYKFMHNIGHFPLFHPLKNGMSLQPVNISYARLDIISVQSKFTTVAYVESLKETKSQDRHNIYPRKPSRGRKPNKTSSV